MIFHSERLDDPDADRGLLQSAQDTCRGHELRLRMFADPTHQDGDAEDRRRHDQKRESAHGRVLSDHHPHEPDDRQNVATDANDQHFQNAAGGLRIVLNAGCQFAGRGAVEVGQVLFGDALKHAPLTTGHDRIADPAEDHHLTVGRRAFDREDHHDHAGDHIDHELVAVDEDLVDDVLHDPGACRRGCGDQRHAQEGKDVA